jgi:ankyrin repeat protein
VLELLARLGARLGVADRLGQTPLFVAASENLADTVRLLVRCGARARECVSVGARESVRARECVSVHTPNTYGCTPLYAAAMNGCLEVIQLLHELGADVDAPNNTGDAATDELP